MHFLRNGINFKQLPLTKIKNKVGLGVCKACCVTFKSFI